MPIYIYSAQNLPTYSCARQKQKSIVTLSTFSNNTLNDSFFLTVYVYMNNAHPRGKLCPQCAIFNRIPRTLEFRSGIRDYWFYQNYLQPWWLSYVKSKYKPVINWSALIGGKFIFKKAFTRFALQSGCCNFNH